MDGVLRQTATAEKVLATIGHKKTSEPMWSDYTLTLKARKLGGEEGFLILFNQPNKPGKSWWNLGGWGNQRHAIEMGGLVGQDVPGSIETGRWYDIKVELKGGNVTCYLDGKLIHDAQSKPMKALYASSTLSADGKEVILKVVNASASEQATAVRLNGLKGVSKTATAVVLSSADAMDENSLEQPTKVAPVSVTIDNAAESFTHAFPGNSVTVLRLPVKK